MGTVNLNLNSPAAYAIQNAASLVANVANQYIVSTNGAPPGVSGFVFDILDVEEMSLQSDITDHYIETNSAIQDHIAQKPVKFTLKGYVGELKQILDIQTTDVFSQIAGLLPLGILLPSFNTQDTQVYTSIASAAAQAQSAIAAIGSISSLIPQLMGNSNYQQQAYSTMYGLWINRTLCTVQTPFGLLTNMAIEDLRPSQSGDTRFVSSFSITFKQIQQVGTAVTSTAASPNPAGSSTQSGNQLQLNQSSAINNAVNPPPPNYPSQPQSGITSTNASGRVADMLAPPAALPGANNSGVQNFPGTTTPVTPDLVFPPPQPASNNNSSSPVFNTFPGLLATPIAPVIP
jgi:hypothetical protein